MKGKRKVGLSCLHIKFMLGLFLVLVSVSFISAFNFGDKSIVTSDVYIINSSEVTHNNLFGLQGGTTGEYYHIRESWYDELLSDIFDWITQAEGDARYSLISEPLWSDNFTKYNTTWSTDTDTFIGNYSTFLTHIDWSDAVNGTLLTDEVDPQWSDNFTKYNTTWSTDTGILWSDAVNGTLYLASNPSNYINWGDAVNGTLFTQTEWDTNYTANNALWLLDTNTWNTTAEIWAVVYNGTFLESETDPKWVANYSTFLTHITWADAVNGTLLTSESDPKWLANYSSFLPLKDNSIANALHRHSELVASDGSPDPALSVDATGRVGIGTTSPGTLLSVVGADNQLPALGSNGGSISNIVAGVRGLIMGHATGGDYFMQVQRVDGTATAYDMLFQPNGGNVGIGTTSPNGLLHLVGGNVADYKGMIIDTDGETSDIPFRIRTNTDGGASATDADTKFIVQGNGNVGIGTTAPKNTLNVEGTGNFTSNLTLSNQLNMFYNGTEFVIEY